MVVYNIINRLILMEGRQGCGENISLSSPPGGDEGENDYP